MRRIAVLSVGVWVASVAEAATLRVPLDYPTINQALDAAVSGDTVLVAPGVYDQYETRPNDGTWFSSVAFAKAGVMLRSEGGAAVTTLTMNTVPPFSAPRVVYAYPLDGDFVLQGFTFTGDQVVCMRCVEFHGSGRAVIEDCVFRDYGTGADCEAAVIISTDLEIRHCEFRDINGSTGGGLGHAAGSLLMEDCEFSNVRSGAARADTGTDLVVRRCRFVNNVKTTGGGGAFFVRRYASALFEDCWFEGNQSITGSASGGALALVGIGQRIIQACTFVGNYTNGGGQGGAIRVAGDAVVIERNTFWGNAQELDWSNGGAAIVMEGSTHIFRKNIVAGSTGDQAVSLKTGTLDKGCNVYWNNALGNAFGFTPDATDIEADPLFCDTETNDFTLNVASPCIAGNGHPSCTEQIGAWGATCGAVTLDDTSWGRIKGGFRTDSKEARP